MKNQYFGDINDYRKYGILRCLSGDRLRVSINWMLTSDDGRSDGKFIAYLEQPHRWCHYDEDLFRALRQRVLAGGLRSVAKFDELGLLPGATFVVTPLQDDMKSRAAWFGDTIEAIHGRDLVFFDPDNGVEVPSVRKGTRGSSRYVYWDELAAVWSSGASLLIYQHFPRVAREVFLPRMASEFRSRFDTQEVWALRTSNVAFYLVPQVYHSGDLRVALAQLSHTWSGQVQVEEVTALRMERQIGV